MANYVSRGMARGKQQTPGIRRILSLIWPRTPGRCRHLNIPLPILAGRACASQPKLRRFTSSLSRAGCCIVCALFLRRIPAERGPPLADYPTISPACPLFPTCPPQNRFRLPSCTTNFSPVTWRNRLAPEPRESFPIHLIWLIFFGTTAFQITGRRAIR